MDDDPAAREFLKVAAARTASRVDAVADAAAALETIEGGNYDIIFSDICLPGSSGLELLAMAKQSRWDVGFIVATGQVSVEQIIEALHLGAADFLLKPFTIEALGKAIARAYRLLRAEREARAYGASLESSLERRTQDLGRAIRKVEENYQTTLEALAGALDAREHETYAHSLRVRAYTTHLARLAGYPPALLPLLSQAALLHDIGKIAVADSILLKPGKLSADEWVEMRRHVVTGERILKRVPFLRPAASVVRHHHERYDGKGYPDGLAGEQIPLGARLFAIADTLDAMTSDRTYRKAPGFSEVLEVVVRQRNRQFDPQVADMFLKIPEAVWKRVRVSVERQMPSDCSPPHLKARLGGLPHQQTS